MDRYALDRPSKHAIIFPMLKMMILMMKFMLGMKTDSPNDPHDPNEPRMIVQSNVPRWVPPCLLLLILIGSIVLAWAFYGHEGSP
jgi:hypothetical protein